MTLFSRRIAIDGDTSLDVVVFEHGHAYLTVAQIGDRMGFGMKLDKIDEAIDALKQARRAIRHHQHKQGTMTAEERRAAAQTDPEWAENMLASPPHPVNDAEALPSELRLSSQRLLSDKRVRSDGTHVYLVFHHVVQFQDVHITHCNWLLKFFTSSAVTKFHFS